MTIIYSKSPAGFYKAKILHGQNHVRTSTLQSFLLSTSYNVHVMSNTIKDRKLQFCGGNNFSMQSRYLSTSVYLFHSLALFTINVSYVHNVTTSLLDPISQTSSFKTDYFYSGFHFTTCVYNCDNHSYRKIFLRVVQIYDLSYIHGLHSVFLHSILRVINTVKMIRIILTTALNVEHA